MAEHGHGHSLTAAILRVCKRARSTSKTGPARLVESRFFDYLGSMHGMTLFYPRPLTAHDERLNADKNLQQRRLPASPARPLKESERLVSSTPLELPCLPLTVHVPRRERHTLPLAYRFGLWRTVPWAVVIILTSGLLTLYVAGRKMSNCLRQEES